jgi:hypothetical protein
MLKVVTERVHRTTEEVQRKWKSSNSASCIILGPQVKDTKAKRFERLGVDHLGLFGKGETGIKHSRVLKSETGAGSNTDFIDDPDVPPLC